MTFDLKFVRTSSTGRDASIDVPDLSGDYESDVMEVCSLLAEASAGEFTLAGFGREPWPLDVAYDMSAFMEQFPGLLASMKAGTSFDVDLYSQGIEASLTFETAGTQVLIHCTSRTNWKPNPETERIDRSELVRMLETLARDVATALQSIAPQLAGGDPFVRWLRWGSDDAALDALLDAGLDDWASLDEVIWEVTHGDLSAESRARVLGMLDRIYSEGLVVPGDLGGTGFEDWPGSPDEWLERSREELEQLDWKPMGGGFWLRLTERGEAKAREPKVR